MSPLPIRNLIFKPLAIVNSKRIYVLIHLGIVATTSVEIKPSQPDMVCQSNQQIAIATCEIVPSVLQTVVVKETPGYDPAEDHKLQSQSCLL